MAIGLSGAILAQDEPQISGFDFWLKILGVYLAVVCILAYAGARYRRTGSQYFVGPQRAEQEMLRSGSVRVGDLQHGPWKANAQKVATYSAFSLGALISAVVFLFTQQPVGFDRLLFQILLFIYGLSVMGYFISLQFWFLALDLGGLDSVRLRYRHHATSFQTAGWFAMQLAATVAVMVVSTLLGWIFAACGVAGFVWVYEVKYRMSTP